MTSTLRLGRFPFQVRLVLVLLVLFLAALDLINLYLLNRARRAAAEAEGRLARELAVGAVTATGPEIWLAAKDARGRGPGLAPTALRKLAIERGLSRIALLDAGGREIVSSSPAPPQGLPRMEAGTAAARGALMSGRAVVTSIFPARGGEEALLGVYVPVMDPAGKMACVVEAVREVPGLGLVEARFRLVLGIQVAGVLLIGALAILFANWVSRPYRTLAKMAGEAGLSRSARDSAVDPDELAASFRAVVAKLREQEEALGAVRREAGGLADLVRFATSAAAAMSTGVVVVDRKGRVAAVNRAAAEALGVDPEAVRGREIEDAAAHLRGLPERVQASIREGRTASREVLDVDGDGGRIGHVGVAVSPAMGPFGEIVGALVLMTDLTEIRRLQEQARIRENLAAVGHLSAGIAHEFRNALATILGYARMLEKREDPRVHGPAREIAQEVESVRAAVDDFLLYARPPEMSRVPLELGDLLRACAAGAPEGLAVDVEGEYGTIVGDPGLLRRAFSNLLQNAADVAREAGRSVKVRVSGTLPVGSRWVLVEVEDDGPGIPREAWDRIFIPFFTTRSKGTGLGLALVQRTLIEHGGSIEVGAAPEGGALFRIRLPLARQTGEAPSL